MWIELDGAVNARELGGLPTTDGRTTRPDRLLRSDNLQDLSPADVTRLVEEHGVRHVVDLRSEAEVKLEGPGPLTREPRVRIHSLSLFPEGGQFTDVEADADDGTGIDGDKILPWAERNEAEGPAGQRALRHYLGYLAERPDSVVSALRVVASGTAIVHCAAGKDRTGVVVALALTVAGVTREAIVADYAATGERIEAILARLRSSTTYAQDLDSRPDDSHIPRPETMERFFVNLEESHGGALGWLAANGWTERDTGALRARLT